jgi:Uma2 family endonuclease
MSMPARVRWTVEHVRHLNAANPRHWPRYEFVGGRLLVTPAPAPRHQLAIGWLFERLAPYTRAHGVGKTILSPADIEVNPGELNQPDVFVVSSPARFASWHQVESLALVIEVVSPGSARHDRGDKRRAYSSAGVEYWLVDLDAQRVERWHPKAHAAEVCSHTLTWRPSIAAEPLELSLAELWREATRTG